jgi:hypothetical protein
MASETSLLNGACTEMLGPQFEGFAALCTGIIAGFIYCWPEALVCLGLAPFIMIG